MLSCKKQSSREAKPGRNEQGADGEKTETWKGLREQCSSGLTCGGSASKKVKLTSDPGYDQSRCDFLIRLDENLR